MAPIVDQLIVVCRPGETRPATGSSAGTFVEAEAFDLVVLLLSDQATGDPFVSLIHEAFAIFIVGTVRLPRRVMSLVHLPLDVAPVDFDLYLKFADLGPFVPPTKINAHEDGVTEGFRGVRGNCVTIFPGW